MEQPIQTANYLREVQDIVIDIHHLPVNDKLLWNEVKELLKNNDLWDDKCGYYKHAKRIYVVTTEHYDFDVLIKNKKLWANDITKEVVYPRSNSLYEFVYIPTIVDNKCYLGLPLDEFDECKIYNYIIILLDNDNVIIGRYGNKITSFDNDNAFWSLDCYYHNETKQVPFDKLVEPYKSLIIEKILEEKQQGYNVENLIHLMPKSEEEEESKNLLQENILEQQKKGNIVMNDPLGRGQTITSSPIRQFSGTIGLLYNNEGYYDYEGEKKLSWSLDDVKELIRKYMRQRSIDKKFDLCIGLSNIETLCYTWEDDFIEEPIVRVYGEIVSRHDGISDEEILNALFELFTYLKVELKQHSVRFNYQGFTEHKSYRIGNGK